MKTALQIDPGDNVATVLANVEEGETIATANGPVEAAGAIAGGHKIALAAIPAGAAVLKYGFPIGHSLVDIRRGEHVHVHNIGTDLTGTLEYRYEPRVDRLLMTREAVTFSGYVRADGRVATRNEVWILPTVGCVGRTAARIASAAEPLANGRIDGVHAFVHPFGCSQLGTDLNSTRSILAALANHPNAGGVLIVGLGCESNQLADLLAELPEQRRGAVRTLVAQRSMDEVTEGIALVRELIDLAVASREEVALDRLVLGVKCGGSDGFSGLTANPLVGKVSDRVNGAGGQTILTEIPEVFGAEQLLMNRAVDETVFGDVVELVNDFKQYFLHHGEPVSENPSPGNLAGGISTLEEKSLGAVQKAGRSQVADVRRYAQQVRRHGLTLLEAPGNDAVSCTALAAAGATVIMFTTGRGTPLGFPVPTLKIATNTDLAARKPNWIDFDAGGVIEQGFDDAEEALVSKLCRVASGELTAAERADEREIAIWKRGVTL